MPPHAPSQPHFPPEIEQALRAFDAGPYPQGVPALQALVRSPAEVGELARLCLNLIHEVTTDLGRATPPPHFNLQQSLLIALGDINHDLDGLVDDDAVDDQLLFDDFGDSQTPLPPLQLGPSRGAAPSRSYAEDFNASSMLPPMLSDPNELSSFAHIDAPQLPDEALEDSLFNSGLLSSHSSHSSHISNALRSSNNPSIEPPRPALKNIDLEDPWDLKLLSAPNPTQPSANFPQSPATPPHAATRPAQTPSPHAPKPLPLPTTPLTSHAPTPQGVPRPRHFSDLKPKSGTSHPQASLPSAPALPPISPPKRTPPAPLPLPLSLSDETPSRPLAPSPTPPPFSQPFHQPATRPRYQNPLQPSPAPPPAAPQTPTLSPAARCRDHLARAQALDAYRCLLDLLSSPSASDDSSLPALQQAVEQALKSQALRYLEPLSRVPSLRITSQALMSRSDLDHRAGYLISQIDGITPLEFLLDLNAMPRQDAALLLLKLSEHGIIAFAAG